MEAIATEVVDMGAKRDTRGRRIALRREREAVVAAYEQSGLTQREFAEREGLKFFTFTGWLRQHRKVAAKPTFAEVKVAKRPVATLELILPSGTMIRGGEAEQIAALARALGVC